MLLYVSNYNREVVFYSLLERDDEVEKVLVLGEQDFWETFSRSTLKRWTRCNDCDERNYGRFFWQ